MMLNAQQLAIIENQTDTKPLPPDDPAVAQLSGHFGEHSFFLDPNGLYIFEAVNLPETEEGTSPALLVQIAEWTDPEKTSIGPIEPKPADLIIGLALGVADAE